MAEVSTAVTGEKDSGNERRPPGPPVATWSAPGAGGFLDRYKPEQGKWTRGGTFVGLLALALGGGWFLYDRLQVYAGDLWWQLLIVYGIPLVYAVGFGGLAWWFSYTNRRTSDFMIATEGEMKKVSWSSRREVMGSTRVVIVITFLMAVLLFAVDLFLQTLFRWIGMLKV